MGGPCECTGGSAATILLLRLILLLLFHPSSFAIAGENTACCYSSPIGPLLWEKGTEGWRCGFCSFFALRRLLQNTQLINSCKKQPTSSNALIRRFLCS